jgi:glycosyltransferase involved in cell wall biosynthesis
MTQFPIFLSLVVVLRNRAPELESLLRETAAAVRELVSDYELVVVDNGSDDSSVAELKRLADAQGLPNLQVYALTKEVDPDTAAWAGLENALGDFIAVIDPIMDDVNFLPTMIEHSVSGADAVFAANQQKPPQRLVYRLAFAVFNWLYKSFNGIHLAKDVPKCRILSRRVVNFILQHSVPASAYRHLPATSGFARVNLSYSTRPKSVAKAGLAANIDRGVRSLISTTRAPMRLATTLSLFGAFANALYSVYVVAVGLFKADVAPGWVTLSLQQSGMFLLVSLVLFVMSEYTLHIARQSSEGPPYHVAREFTSASVTRRDRLNVEEVPFIHAPEYSRVTAERVG